MSDAITELAARLLQQSLDPVLRLRVLRDLLQMPADQDEYRAARQAALAAPQVTEALHGLESLTSLDWTRQASSMAACDQQVTRLLELGVEPSHPVMATAADCLGRALQAGRWQAPSDQLKAASLLNRLDPDHPMARDSAARWSALASASFSQGFFDSARYHELMQQQWPQADLAGPVLIFSVPALRLLPGHLSVETENSMIHHILEKERGIDTLLTRSLRHLPLQFPSLESNRYLAAIDIMLPFASAIPLLSQAYDWLWDQMHGGGLWDLGQAARDGVTMPLSASWRPRLARQQDSTFRVLYLLQRLQFQCDIRRRNCHEI